MIVSIERKERRIRKKGVEFDVHRKGIYLFCAIQMPFYILTKEHEFDEIILERRLNVFVFTVCWSLGSKMIFPTIFDLSSNQNLTHMNFYRIDIDENNRELAERLNIVRRFFWKRMFSFLVMFRYQYRLFNGIFMERN